MRTKRNPDPRDAEASGELVLVKLGGSVITDKSQVETPRLEVIDRLACEVAGALCAAPGLRLILGHGSGSFGHMMARRYGTRQGVHSPGDWFGFAQVADVAAQLNRLVTQRFLAAGVPAWSLQPSASARCRGGALLSLEIEPLVRALDRGLTPLVYGDVALDDVQGGTILSTEQIFGYLARRLDPARLVLVGQVDGVFEGDPLSNLSVRHVPAIHPENWHWVQAVLGGSHATDVTGGMLSKVEEMVSLAQDLPGLTVHLISGQQPGALQTALLEPRAAGGTTIDWG